VGIDLALRPRVRGSHGSLAFERLDGAPPSALGVAAVVIVSPRVHMVEVEYLPLAYLPGNSLRTRVRVVGEIARQP
jgi:hypothetical protein